MARHRTKKCPNCGQKTIVDDKWSSCQWCHWPLYARRPPEIEQRRSIVRSMTRRRAVVSVLVVVSLCYGLALFQSSGWKWSELQQVILEQWPVLLLLLAALLVVALSSLYLIYLVANIATTRPELLFGVLVALGILLLLASQKGNPISQHMYEWIDERWHINVLSAALTVLSLALAFGAIVIGIGRTRK